MVATILFYVFAGLAVLGAVMVIVHRNPIYSALSLILTLFSLAGIYVLLMAHFIAIVHIAVYAGAIMVLFLFVIMLLNVRIEEKAPGAFRYMVFLAVPMVAILFYELAQIAFAAFHRAPVKNTDVGSVESIGNALFSQYVLPFEITSIILIVAMAGAVYLAKRRLNLAKD